MDEEKPQWVKTDRATWTVTVGGTVYIAEFSAGQWGKEEYYVHDADGNPFFGSTSSPDWTSRDHALDAIIKHEGGPGRA